MEVPPPILVTRAELTDVLLRWQEGRLDAAAVQEWASFRCFPGEVGFDDEEGDASVAKEVLFLLDNLGMNLVTVADVPIHLSFLATPPGRFGEGYQRWREALERIDWTARRLELREEPLYAPFCR